MPDIQKYCSANVPDTHFHTGYELIYVHSGHVQVKVAGLEYAVQAPACIFFSNLETHALSNASESYERYAVIISPDEATNALKNPVLSSVFRNRPQDFCHVLPCNGCDVQQILEDMLAESEKKDAFSENCLLGLFYRLIVLLYRRHPDFFPLHNHEYSSSLLAVQQYLDEHYRENLSIQEIAQHFFISPGYLQHRFTELVGCSPKQYLILSRLSAAQHLLLTTRLTITQVAAECGFSGVNNFIRRFSAHFDETPAQYRSRHTAES